MYRNALKIAARNLLPAKLRRSLKRWAGIQVAIPASEGYEILNQDVPNELLRGWQNPTVAQIQQVSFSELLRQMYLGSPRGDFIALAKAVEMTSQVSPLILEVGCASGWNQEVLRQLWNRPFRYVGLDYSHAMISLGKQSYPHLQFLVGDATRLPFRNCACDILISGTVLMHLLGYREAIQESRRVTRRWCIFHTVPVVKKQATTFLRKRAYGQPVFEVIFNEGELLELMAGAGLMVRATFPSIFYHVNVLPESGRTKTYLCEIV